MTGFYATLAFIIGLIAGQEVERREAAEDCRRAPTEQCQADGR